ncbi:MAG: SRPBCC family protein [Thalassotalea sp.]
MPKINAQHSVLINAPIAQVYAILSDFNQWRVWSPWLITEPEAEMTVADDGQSYQWQGCRVGAGAMQKQACQNNSFLHFQLNFLKPWKSTAQVQLELLQVGESVQVTWSMQSSLPLFLFWMKNMMQALITMDYERGLLMLKDYVETGQVHCQLTMQAEHQFAGGQYIGVNRSCKKAQLAQTMPEDFGKLMAFARQHPDLTIVKACTIYHKFDLVSGDVDYTAGLLVTAVPASLPEDLILGEIPKMKVYSVLQTGPYHLLGNAWSMIMGLQRAKAFKISKQHPPFELYHDNPEEVTENDLTTEVIFSCK